MPDGHEPISSARPDSWEIRLEAQLTEHGVSDAATVVARWKEYREAALGRLVTDLRTQLRIAQADTGSPAKVKAAHGPDPAPHERILSAIGSIHPRITVAESRLLNVVSDAGQAIERLERTLSELEKSLAVLRDRLPRSGQDQQASAGGLGSVIGFGAALAAVVVTLVLALSLLLRSVSP